MKRALVASLAAVFVAMPSVAADVAKDRSKIVVEGKRVVELADGGEITIDNKGRTYHTDAQGKRVRMRDGVVMEGKDGAKYLHKNDVIWKQITEKGTLAPNR
jgi:cytoskeletal protein CcmA (bactofilin family)